MATDWDTGMDMVDTTVDTLDMADTDMLTTTASVPLMLSPRLMPRPIPHTCMLAITAMPAIPMALTVILMVPTTATAQLLLPATNTSPLLLPLMASTNSTNVMLMPNPRLMPPLLTMVVTTATPATTDTDTGTVDTTVDTMVDSPMAADTDMLTTTASVPLKLNPQCLTPTVAPKVPVDSTDSPMPVMPPLPTTAFPTTDKLRAIVSPGEDF